MCKLRIAKVSVRLSERLTIDINSIVFLFIPLNLAAQVELCMPVIYSKERLYFWRIRYLAHSCGWFVPTHIHMQTLVLSKGKYVNVSINLVVYSCATIQPLK